MVNFKYLQISGIGEGATGQPIGTPSGAPPGYDPNSPGQLCERNSKTANEYRLCILKAMKTDPVVRRKVIQNSFLPAGIGLALLIWGLRSKSNKTAKMGGGVALIALGVRPWIKLD